ncbi:helix-turn-helix domain-containing protein [Aquicoccus sp. SCR17]|nr:helix-turn-helix domain-containing protein [Carideicomes alvinocaridis]
MDGTTIRELRRRLGITQHQLADRIGVDQGTISRWERGVENPRPRRAARLRQLLVRDEERRHMDRSLALIRHDLQQATLLDERLKIVEISASGERFFRARGQDPTRLLGMSFDRYVDRIGAPKLMDQVAECGLLKGDALLFRFTVNARGRGNTTVWEPIFQGGKLAGVLNFVSSLQSFPPNDDFSIECVDFVPAYEPDSMVPLYRGKRAAFIESV